MSLHYSRRLYAALPTKLEPASLPPNPHFQPVGDGEVDVWLVTPDAMAFENIGFSRDVGGSGEGPVCDYAFKNSGARLTLLRFLSLGCLVLISHADLALLSRFPSSHINP